MLPADGIVLVDKPPGISSFGVVARVRRRLSQAEGKKVKVGHTGTLDPFASGLMILVVGSYCKRAGEFSKLDKSYEATLKLGYASSTGDPEGDITPISPQLVDRREFEAALENFRGEITQIPPIFSAIKINGRRAYKLARQGLEIEMPERQVKISRLEVLDFEFPNAKIVCDVSSGTYIRTLAADIGQKLGVGAYTVALRRTRVGEFGIDAAGSVDSAAVVQPDVLPEK